VPQNLGFGGLRKRRIEFQWLAQPEGQQLLNLTNLGISLVEFGQGGGSRPFGPGWNFFAD